MVLLKNSKFSIKSWWLRQAFSALILCFLAPAPGLLAGVHFTLQGSFADNNLGLRTQDSRSASASVAFDLGTHFRLGVTHRQAMNTLEGYGENEATGNYDYSKETTLVYANSLDLTIILFYGEVFVPYVQVGVVRKDFTITSSINQSPAQTAQGTIPLVPNGGLGMGIRLNQNFSLKLSYSLSPGVRQTHPSLEGEPVWDSYTSIGVTYNI